MPRRPAFDAAATARVSIRLTPAQRRALTQVAQENRTDLTGVVREAVNVYVADYREARAGRVFPLRPRGSG